MVHLKVIEISTPRAVSPSTGKKAVAPVEEFIASIGGYDNIKNIVVTAVGALSTNYSIFYEDGQPYTPYVEEEPKKKGIFG
ncbi:MAG: hypothetical protein VB035_03965 [Candidatus Fimivivens sp.]|nr:hypothetical protein [Candidatus Fimivivens sp.]